MTFRQFLGALLLSVSVATTAAAQIGVLKRTSITSNGMTSVLRLDGIQSVGIAVVNSGTYTLQIEASADGGTTYVSVGAVDVSDFSRDTSISGPGAWLFGNQGFTHLRVRASAYTSGAPVVSFARGYGDVNAPLSAGSISGANDAAGTVGSSVPSSSSYTGLNVGGTLRGQTGVAAGSHYAGSVAIVDGSGNHITSFGGGTEQAEDATHTSGALGKLDLAVRSDTATALAAAGDYIPFIVNSVGRLWTTATIDAALPTGTNSIGNIGTITTSITPGTAAANLGKAEDAVAASGDTGVANLVVREDTPTSTASASGDYIHLKADALGKLWTTGSFFEDSAHASGAAGNFMLAVRNDSGSVLADTTGDYIPLTTDSSGALRVTGGGGGQQYAEDAAHVSGDLGTQLLAVRNDAGTTLAGASGDYAPLSLDASGALRVVGSSGTTQYAEDAAHASGDSVVFVGAVRRDTTPSSSAGTAGDYSALNVDANGRLYTNTVLYAADGSALTLNSDVIEDAPETAGVSGPMVLSVRRDTVASSAGTTGDNATFNSGAEGGLYTSLVATGANGAGALPAGIASAASTNSTNVKSSPGQVYSVTLINVTNTLYYLRFYNLASAPTCSSATGFLFTLPVPASTSGAGVTVPFPTGLAFSTGIGYCLTGGASSTDNTNAAIGVYGVIAYK